MFPTSQHPDELPDDEPRYPVPGAGRKPLVTWALLGAVGLAWGLTELGGGSTDSATLIAFGAMEAGAVAAGDYWRLFTAIFLHSGAWHVGLNCAGLFILGTQAEKVYGHVRFSALYLLSGLGASALSYALNLSRFEGAVGVGASGAIFGLLGGLTAFFLVNRDRLGKMGRSSLTALLLLAAVNLAFGLAIPGIDNYAHVGGFVSGALLGLAFAPDYKPAARDPFGRVARLYDANSLWRRAWVVPLAVVAICAGALWGNRNVGESPLSHSRQAQRHLDAGEIERAIDSLEKALEISPEYAPAYISKAKALAAIGRRDSALADLGKALRFAANDAQRNEALRLLVQINGGLGGDER